MGIDADCRGLTRCIYKTQIQFYQMTYEWGERKRLLVLEKHGIDFRDAIKVFGGNAVFVQARSEIEPRTIAIGPMDGILIAVVYSRRGQNIRLVTARRARKNERRTYDARYP